MSGEKWGYIQTFTGLHFYPSDPHVDQICIEDIAMGLSREARFNGHTNDFYSVAQHSIFCSTISLAPHKLSALLHDASEAYLKDLPWPVKLLCPEYKDIEARTMRVIAEKFGLEYPDSPAIKIVDLIALATERRDLLGVTRHSGDLLPADWNIVPLSSTDAARRAFLKEFKKLTGG